MTTPNITITGFLVVDAAGTMRALKTPPRLAMDEVAFPITVTIPRTWGRVQTTRIDVTMPEPPEARVTVGDPELAPDEPPQEDPTP
jgi:hypothetical protein